MRGGPLSTRSLHALVVSKLALEKRAACLVNGRQDTSLCGQASPWAHVLHALPSGAIPASTGRNVVSVGRTHPVIIRIVSFSATSSFFCMGAAAADR